MNENEIRGLVLMVFGVLLIVVAVGIAWVMAVG